ncbi:MAG: 50S ribosomal protein L21 [Elusimicrobiaceae bacterium]|nr:50S ribosomal protein L21 [Elusimicrobiaceae bacterium]
MEKNMYAIIETGGKQYWVKPGQDLQVEKLEAEIGANIELKVLWAASEEGTSADTKASSNAKVTAQVVKHLRGPKILVFKRRPKKGYERTRGHRQDLTQIKITDIVLG